MLFKTLKDDWKVEGSLKFQNDSLHCACRKKQRLKSLPTESHKHEHFCPGFVEQARVVVLDYISPDYPPIPLRSKKPMLSRSNSPVLLFSMKGVNREDDSKEKKNHIVLNILFNYAIPSIL